MPITRARRRTMTLVDAWALAADARAEPSRSVEFARRAKKLERRKNLYWTGRSSLLERRVLAAGSKAASSTSSISQSQRAGSRIKVLGPNLGPAITPPLDDNSAGGHPIARGIARGPCGERLYHEGTGGHCPFS